jgi:hypothetical protein
MKKLTTSKSSSRLQRLAQPDSAVEAVPSSEVSFKQGAASSKSEKEEPVFRPRLGSRASSWRSKASKPARRLCAVKEVLGWVFLTFGITLNVMRLSYWFFVDSAL